MNVDFTQETVGLCECVNGPMKIRLPRMKALSSLEGLLYTEETLELFIIIQKKTLSNKMLFEGALITMVADFETNYLVWNGSTTSQFMTLWYINLQFILLNEVSLSWL